MVLGSQPSRVATYSVSPCPSLAASMAAYRLRSFSESESWNIRKEPSNGTAAGHPKPTEEEPTQFLVGEQLGLRENNCCCRTTIAAPIAVRGTAPAMRRWGWPA